MSGTERHRGESRGTDERREGRLKHRFGRDRARGRDRTGAGAGAGAGEGSGRRTRRGIVRLAGAAGAARAAGAAGVAGALVGACAPESGAPPAARAWRRRSASPPWGTPPSAGVGAGDRRLQRAQDGDHGAVRALHRRHRPRTASPVYFAQFVAGSAPDVWRVDDEPLPFYADKRSTTSWTASSPGTAGRSTPRTSSPAPWPPSATTAPPAATGRGSSTPSPSTPGAT